MTGGEAVILGTVGDNFAAGMTGGRACVYDPARRLEGLLNPDTAAISEPDEAALADCRALVEQHLAITGSPRAQALLDDWIEESRNMRLVAPRETEGAKAARQTAEAGGKR